MSSSRVAKVGRYRVEVEQHGCVDVEAFESFEALTELLEAHSRMVGVVAGGMGPRQPSELFRKYIGFIDLLERRIEELQGERVPRSGERV